MKLSFDEHRLTTDCAKIIVMNTYCSRNCRKCSHMFFFWDTVYNHVKTAVSPCWTAQCCGWVI